MPLFVPEWQRASGRELQIKRVLDTLSDQHVIRRPLRQQACPATLFVQHPQGNAGPLPSFLDPLGGPDARRQVWGRSQDGWLALAVCETPFADLDPSSLFAGTEREAFEAQLAALETLALPALVVMWQSSTDEVRRLGRPWLGVYRARLVSREQFLTLGAKLVAGSMAALSPSAAAHLLGAWFPEAEIAACHTAQRFAVPGAEAHDSGPRLPRFFLDAQQEWAVKLDLDLPAHGATVAKDFAVRVVNGVAGSGKTLIALHRALLLAELFKKHRVLLLIHNTPVVADLRHRLQRSRGPLPDHLQIQTFSAWASAQYKRAWGRWPKMATAAEVLAWVQHHRLNWPQLSLGDAQLVAELDYINELLIPDEASYLAAQRTGRGFAMRSAERSQVWALREAVQTNLRQRGKMLWSALPAAACHPHAGGGELERYEHILIDEAQFCAPSWFELVRRSAAPGGHLFLCADPTQGFMRHRLSWKSVGLDMTGRRTTKLRRSYRTTRAILSAATQLVAACLPEDREDELEPDFTGMPEGTRPWLLYVKHAQDAIDQLVDELSQQTGGPATEGGLPLSAFLVMYGDNAHKGALYAQLCKKFNQNKVWWFNVEEQKKAPPGGHDADHLRLANIDTATGLEAAVVFVLGIEPLLRRVHEYLADDAGAAAQPEADLRKLYMAMTRAGQKLVLLSSQRLPAAIEALFEVR